METKQSNFTLLLHKWEENSMNKKQTQTVKWSYLAGLSVS